MWVDTPNASIANSASEAATPAFTVEGLDESGYVYAIDCGTLTAGSHTLTFDGAAGNWLPDICAVGIYPTDPTEFYIRIKTKNCRLRRERRIWYHE